MRRGAIFSIVIVSALAVTTSLWQLAERRARGAEARLAAVTDSLRRVPARAPAPVPAADPGTLRRLDLSNREREILDDLARHPELIPYKGLEGGTMRFYSSECSVLSPEWVYGYFEDGHIVGHGLFRYRVEPGGQITWKRLDARLD